MKISKESIQVILAVAEEPCLVAGSRLEPVEAYPLYLVEDFFGRYTTQMSTDPWSPQNRMIPTISSYSS